MEAEGRWLGRPRPSLPETFRGAGHHGLLMVSGVLVGLVAGGLSGLLGGPGFGSRWVSALALLGGLLLLAGVALYLRRPVEHRPARR